jgi:hypothetical protein
MWKTPPSSGKRRLPRLTFRNEVVGALSLDHYTLFLAMIFASFPPKCEPEEFDRADVYFAGLEFSEVEKRFKATQYVVEHVGEKFAEALDELVAEALTAESQREGPLPFPLGRRVSYIRREGTRRMRTRLGESLRRPGRPRKVEESECDGRVRDALKKAAKDGSPGSKKKVAEIIGVDEKTLTSWAWPFGWKSYVHFLSMNDWFSDEEDEKRE